MTVEQAEHDVVHGLRDDGLIDPGCVPALVVLARAWLARTERDVVMHRIESLFPGRVAMTSRLSPSEHDLLTKISEGRGPKQVALDRRRSVKTIEAQREAIKFKLNLANATELTTFAVLWGCCR